jgi:hypothetical protein
MDVRPAARSAAAGERTIDMADLRMCIGSARFGIEPHDAPIDDFPSQPSQKDGLGRMCQPHWNAYTAGLARDAKARKAAAEGATVEAASVAADNAVGAEDAPASASEPAATRTRRRSTPTQVAADEGDAA